MSKRGRPPKAPAEEIARTEEDLKRALLEELGQDVFDYLTSTAGLEHALGVTSAHLRYVRKTKPPHHQRIVATLKKHLAFFEELKQMPQQDRKRQVSELLTRLEHVNLLPPSQGFSMLQLEALRSVCAVTSTADVHAWVVYPGAIAQHALLRAEATEDAAAADGEATKDRELKKAFGDPETLGKRLVNLLLHRPARRQLPPDAERVRKEYRQAKQQGRRLTARDAARNVFGAEDPSTIRKVSRWLRRIKEEEN